MALVARVGDQLAPLIEQASLQADAPVVALASRPVADACEEQLQEMRVLQGQLRDELSRMDERLTAQQLRLTQLLERLHEGRAPARPARDAGRTAATAADTRPTSGDRRRGVGEGEWLQWVGKGEASRVAWIRDGLLVPTARLAEHWGRTRQGLDQACERGEIFSLKVGKNKYFPTVFLGLDAGDIKRVCLALLGNDSTAKFVFWNRRHGALGGRTVAEAIAQGGLARAQELALGWSEERGLVNAPAA